MPAPHPTWVCAVPQLYGGGPVATATVVVTNSLGWNATSLATYGQFPDGTNVTVTDLTSGAQVPSQVTGGALYWLARVESLGFASYSVSLTSGGDDGAGLHSAGLHSAGQHNAGVCVHVCVHVCMCV